jgi:hypothetical protein
MVTPRSRRLRTVGLLLLAAAVTMALYGFLVLMPSLKHIVAAAPASSATVVTGKTTVAHPAGRSWNEHLSQMSRKERRVAAAKVIFAYGYWSVCGLLVISMVFIAWLDLREVSRTYLNQRRAIWTETAQRLNDQQEG